MNWRDYIRPIIAGLIAIALVILVIVLIVKAFSGGGTSSTNKVDVGQYENSAAVATLLIDNPTQVDQDHRQVKITVTQTQNEIDLIQGYQGNVIDSRTYPSNSAAYGAFLQSLKLLNFAKGSADKTDYRGYCPTGDRYLYTFNDGQKDLFSYWSTSCGGQGTFRGDAKGVRQLFEAQIPNTDFHSLISGANIIQ